MASSSFITISKPFNLHSFSNQRSLSSSGTQRASLRINAMATKWEPTQVVPQGDRVLIRLEELPQKSAGGVLLPKSAVKFEKYLMGEILSVGTEVAEVEPGKNVLFSDINAYEVNVVLLPSEPFNTEITLKHPSYLNPKERAYGVVVVTVNFGTEGKYCFCQASELLAVVE
ncbi:hypothetical protein GIB67_013539 [Kingdonia uniflora]|uniref:Uncharacterized protein n=1 Tax=Kingdonia uniflora TaxID=39325 RepID=A0A7J7KUZ7_9MAGN|nr:hypothetical protein GIB67_013539 [Kingdonia uniflora]